MSKYILFLILFNLCLCRNYTHIDKSPFDFELNESTFEYGAYLGYNDIIEVDDKVSENTMYFLKINEELKVKCVISKEDKEPTDEELNINTSNEYCQLNIKLLNDAKLITFPKNIEKGQSIYFLFYIDREETPEFFLQSSLYEITRVNVPKPLENKDYIFDLDKGEINMYLMKETKDHKYHLISTLSNFNIDIYALSEKKFVKVGYIGEKSPFFLFNNSITLDNDYLYIIVDNYKDQVEPVKFTYIENINLLRYSADKKVEYKLETPLTLLQIHSQDNKLLKFNFTEGAHPRVIIENNKSMINIIDESYYEYLPSRFYYLTKEYLLFLIRRFETNSYLSIEVPDLSQPPKEVEMDNFVYFKIQKDSELEFTVKYPENPIVLKLICTNTGNVEINDENYSFERQNQIKVIDNHNSETLKIKALDNDLILAVKSKIPEENIVIGEAGKSLKVPENNTDTFITFDVNYTDYDYIQFYSYYNRQTSQTVPKFTTDFGFLSINEIEKNDYYYTSGDESIYNLKYYRNRLHLNEEADDLKKVFYYTNISNNSDITVGSYYYKEFTYEENEFIKINEKQKYLIPIKQKMRLFLMAERACMFELHCPGNNMGIVSWNEIGFTMTNDNINCYASFENIGYIYIQHYEDDKIYSFEDIEWNENTT